MDGVAPYIVSGLNLLIVLVIRQYLAGAKKTGEEARIASESRLSDKIYSNLSAVNEKFENVKEALTSKIEITNAKIDTIKQITEEQWQVINKHGHRGLKGNGNEVTRR